MSKLPVNRRALMIGAASAVGLAAGVGVGQVLNQRARDRREPEPQPEVLPGPRPQGAALNVLLISSDEHNAGWMGHAGHPWVKTPRLDRLAADGLSLTGAYAASPVCAPARQSLLTGLYSPEHGQLHNHFVLDARTRTLAHHFGEAGWDTACIGKMHTNNEHLDFGFRYRPTNTGLSPEKVAEAVRGAKGGRGASWDGADHSLFRSGPDRRFIGAPLEDAAEVPDARIAQLALDYLARPHTRPFFLYVSFLQPHFPWYLPKEWYYQYNPDDLPLPEVDESDLKDSLYALERYRQQGWDRMSPQLRRLIQARYAGGLGWMDHHVGVLLDALDAAGLRENTVVAYVSDHGEMAGQKGLWLKSLMFEGAVRIPVILRLPGVIPAGARSGVLTSQVDLFPTLAALSGAPAPAGLSGQDRSAALVEGAPGPERVFSIEGAQVSGGLPAILMSRSARWKLNLYRQRYGGGDRFMELYDLEADPQELRNLAYDPAHAEVVAAETAAAEAFYAGLRPCPYSFRKERALEAEDDD